MINAFQAFSPTAYSAATLQAKLDALRVSQRALGDTAQREASLRATESAGLQTAQTVFTPGSFQTTPPVDDALGQRQARNLRGNALKDTAAPLARDGSAASFRLGDAGAQAATLAGLQNPKPTLDSAAFVNLFANARPSLNLAAVNASTQEAAALPFRRATSTLSEVYGAGEERAFDLAA